MKGSKLRLLFWVALALLLAAELACAATYQVQGNQVIVQKARFTVLADGLVRLEYSPSGQFEDRTTAVVVNRKFPPVEFTVEEANGFVQIKTARLLVKYKPAGPFSGQNLYLIWQSKGKARSWQPGQRDPFNLKGTRTSLDGMHGDRPYPLDDGVLSRSGWYLLDDSATPLWDEQEKWLVPRQDPLPQDWYFFCYGHDYAQALKWYTALCGRIPMPPRVAFGTWYSRYWPYTQAEEEEVVKTFRRLEIPLDVLVVDVDWHLYGWSGFDWNPKLFPKPAEFISWLHSQGVALTLNDHPGWLPKDDSHFAKYIELSGQTPEKDGVHINLADKRQAQAFFEAVQHPMLDEGMDWTWIDGCNSSMKGLNCFLWTNRMYYLDRQHYLKQRGLIFSRYGGLGNHRYPLGFSGDTYSEWGVLAYEVPFTATAGNVGMAYWSHDIGGFQGNKLDPELYTRWVEFGTFSPVLRLHSNHGVREPWNYGRKALQVTKRYFQLRERLFPFFYTLAHETYQTSLPLCRPLYLEYPDLEEAYENPQEYLLGENALVAPVAHPAGAGGVALQQVWLPPGTWYDWWTDEVYQGPQQLTYRADLATTPLFVKAGGVVPEQPVMQHLGEKPADPITLNCYLGAECDYNLYEDDGNTLDYQQGVYSLTPVKVKQSGDELVVKVGSTKGTYLGRPKARSYVLKLHGVVKASGVEANGKRLPRGSDAPGWELDMAKGLLTIRLPSAPLEKGWTVKVQAVPSEASLEALFALKSYGKRAETTSEAAKGLAPADFCAELKEFADQCKALYWRLAYGRVKSPDYQGAAKRVASQYADFWQKACKLDLPDEQKSELLTLLFNLAPHLELQSSGAEKLRLKGSCKVPSLLKGAHVELRLQAPEGWRLAPTPQGAGLDMTATAPDRLPVRPVTFTLKAKVTHKGESAIFEARRSVDCSWLQRVKLVGAFETDGTYKGVTDVLPPDTNFQPDADYATGEGKAKWVTLQWQPILGEQKPVINFNHYFGNYKQGIAYAAVRLVADKPCQAILHLGSDDGCQVFLNGKVVYEFTEPRPLKVDEDAIPLELQAGDNLLVVKVANDVNQSELAWRLSGPDGKPLEGVWQALPE